MGFLDTLSNIGTGLGGALFPSDPSLASSVDPGIASSARNNALIRLGLGIMQAPYNFRGLGAGLNDALSGAQTDYGQAMDTAFRHTLAKTQIQNAQEDRDFLQQERALQLKTQQRAEREQGAQTAQRVLTGLQSAPDPQAYLNLVGNSPEFKDALSTLGIQAPYSGPLANPANMDQFRQQLTAAAGVGAPAQAPIKLSQGDVLVAPGTYQPLASAAPKSTVEWKDAGDKLFPVDSVSGQRLDLLPATDPRHRDAVPKTQTPTQEAKNFAPDEGALMGALAERGLSLPAGMRSQQQMKATFRGLIDRNPGKSTDDIADMVRTGQLDFNGAKRSTAQLMTISAAANVQASKLEKDFAQLEPLVAKLPNAPNVINRALVGLKNNLSFGGDKDSAELVLYMREAATEYAKLSSGSTGTAAPAEGNIREAVEIFHKAFTEGGYQGLKEAMLKSAQNKRDAVQEGLKAAATRGAAVGAGATGSAPAGADGKPLW